jgi:hypothetical protein
MGIGGGILHQEACVLLQRTSAVVEIVDLHFDSRRVAQRNQFLLYGIPGKRVSYTKDTDE